MSAPHGLTVGRLRALLAQMPNSFDDRLVVTSGDPEGNGFNPITEVAVVWFRNLHDNQFRGCVPNDEEGWEQAAETATLDYTVDEGTEEYVSLDENDHPAICLWP